MYSVSLLIRAYNNPINDKEYTNHRPLLRNNPINSPLFKTDNTRITYIDFYFVILYKEDFFFSDMSL